MGQTPQAPYTGAFFYERVGFFSRTPGGQAVLESASLTGKVGRNISNSGRKSPMKKQILALALLVAGSAYAGTPVQCTIVSVSDGDTISCVTAAKQQLKVRMGKIDAPEKNQPFGMKAKQALSDAIFGKVVTVTPETTDQYGRTVGLISYAGKDINLQQVQLGMAWVYTQYTNDPAFYAAEKDARAARRGLWSEPNPIRPSEWRHGDQKTAATPGQQAGPSFIQRISGQQPAKQYCSQMTTCDEARRALAAGMKHLDGNGDGVPCEKLCR